VYLRPPLSPFFAAIALLLSLTACSDDISRLFGDSGPTPEERALATLGLQQALETSDFDQVMLKLAEGAEPDKVSVHSLQAILTPGMSAVVGFMLDAGLDPDAAIGDSNLLFIAHENNATDVVSLLLEEGASPNVNQDGQTLLYRAIAEENMQSVELLIAANVDASIGEEEGQSTVILAITTGYSGLVSDLIARGASPDIQINGITPLGTAEIMMDSEAVDSLLPYLDTPPPEVIKELRVALLESPVGGLDGKLQSAVASFQRENNLPAHGYPTQRTIELVIREFEARSTNAWFYYVMKGDLPAIKEWLKSHPNDLNKTTAEGWSALTFAAARGNFEVALWLVSNGANVKQVGNKGETLLHTAIEAASGTDCRKSCRSLIETLIDKGVDPDLKDIKGVSSKDLAAIKFDGASHPIGDLLNIQPMNDIPDSMIWAILVKPQGILISKRLCYQDYGRMDVEVNSIMAESDYVPVDLHLEKGKPCVILDEAQPDIATYEFKTSIPPDTPEQTRQHMDRIRNQGLRSGDSVYDYKKEHTAQIFRTHKDGFASDFIYSNCEDFLLQAGCRKDNKELKWSGFHKFNDGFDFDGYTMRPNFSASLYSREYKYIYSGRVSKGDFPFFLVSDMYAKGYTIVDLVGWKDIWLIIFSNRSGWTAQKILVTVDDFDAKLRQAQKEGWDLLTFKEYKVN
jgi:ankyrin repeat protein